MPQRDWLLAVAGALAQLCAYAYAPLAIELLRWGPGRVAALGAAYCALTGTGGSEANCSGPPHIRPGPHGAGIWPRCASGARALLASTRCLSSSIMLAEGAAVHEAPLSTQVADINEVMMEEVSM